MLEMLENNRNFGTVNDNITLFCENIKKCLPDINCMSVTEFSQVLQNNKNL